MRGVRWEICHWPRVYADQGVGRHLSKNVYVSIFWRARPGQGTNARVLGAVRDCTEYPTVGTEMGR